MLFLYVRKNMESTPQITSPPQKKKTPYAHYDDLLCLGIVYD